MHSAEIEARQKLQLNFILQLTWNIFGMAHHTKMRLLEKEGTLYSG